MGLIIKDKINMFMVGYPTVSDKYNVTGAVLVGESSAKFGDLVKYSSTSGYYEAITGTVALTDIAGFILATNVKLNETWPSGEVKVNPGEAFNLVLPGSYLAIELDESAKEESIAANKSVAVVLASGKCTTEVVESTSVALPSVVFTGLYEKHGSKIVAEIYVK